MRVWDFSNLVQQIGSYRSPRLAGTDDQGAGDFVIHNSFLFGTTLYESGYTDGVRVVDVSNPRNPQEFAYFVPPATEHPLKPSQRGVLTNTAQVWGVVVDEATGLVHASDMNSDLWILRRIRIGRRNPTTSHRPLRTSRAGSVRSADRLPHGP